MTEPAMRVEVTPDLACCCSSKPTVRVEMLPTAARPHTTNLYLCGHHYQAKKAGLSPGVANVTTL